jgi:exodeoxyribonuclease V beta subunit
LFSTAFFGKDGEITYTNVDAQSEDEQKISIVQREENTICYLTSEAKSDESFKSQMNNFIPAEILRLENEIEIKEKNTTRRLNLGDICILTRTNEDAREIKKVLKNAGIPSEIYKETGVFRSTAALNIQCILDVLMFPGDESRLKKALLTEFYDYTPAELENLTSEQLWEKANLSSLQKIAQRMDWSSFFSELFLCTDIFTKLLAKDSTGHKNTASRKITDYRHIAEVLQENAYREKLNLEGMQKYLDSLRFISDMDFFRKSGSQPTVQIMTIHASKGLEFPVVFVATCKLKESVKAQAYYSYHQDNKLIIDTVLDKNSDAFELYKEENANEHNRLLYVAITRASCKLYLPTNYDALQIPADAQQINISELPPAFTKRAKAQDIQEKLSEEFMNINPEEMQRYFRLESFSSLSAKNEHIEQLESLFAIDSDDFKEEDEVEKQADGVHTILPGGTQTGNMMHKIFELLDFTKIADKDGCQKEQIITSLVCGETEESKIIYNNIAFYYPNLMPSEIAIYANEAANIIYNALNTPLSTSDAASFCLCEIAKSDRISEMNFYMSVPDNDSLQMTGSLDLVFRHNGKYYFLDWKTNSLENYAKTADYTNEHYAMQYKIYLQALKRFLSARLKDKFNFERDFGGIFYLYVRGVTPENPKLGVWFCKP